MEHTPVGQVLLYPHSCFQLYSLRCVASMLDRAATTIVMSGKCNDLTCWVSPLLDQSFDVRESGSLLHRMKFTFLTRHTDLRNIRSCCRLLIIRCRFFGEGSGERRCLTSQVWCKRDVPKEGLSSLAVPADAVLIESEPVEWRRRQALWPPREGRKI